MTMEGVPMNKRFYFVVLCCIFLIFYFSRLVFTPGLVPVEDINADKLLARTDERYPYLVVIQNNRISILNKTTKETLFTYTFKEPESGYKFLSDGILLYGYYPDGFVSCEVLFLDYNLSLRWKIISRSNTSGKYLIILPQSSEEFNGYILMLGGVRRDFEVDKGLLLFNKSNGKLVKVIPVYGEDLKVVKNRAYILRLNYTLGHAKEVWYEILMYDLGKGRFVKAVKTPAEVKYGEMFYAQLIEGEKYIGLHFSDKSQSSDAIDKVCVYNLDLKLIDCLTFEYHEESYQDIYPKLISNVWIMGDYLILQRNSGEKEVYKINDV